MSNLSKKELQELILSNYSYAVNEIEHLSYSQLKDILKKEANRKNQIKNNPNSFWIMGGVPTPKIDNIKKSGTKKWAYWIIISYFVVFILFGLLIWITLLYL